ncbi:MAG: hypothetical protein P4L43_12125 [Syntrophobacteraceae bacterium]|nr:hypothetical protein [Syntrophobacteraceae bacterium]
MTEFAKYRQQKAPLCCLAELAARRLMAGEIFSGRHIPSGAVCTQLKTLITDEPEEAPIIRFGHPGGFKPAQGRHQALEVLELLSRK